MREFHQILDQLNDQESVISAPQFLTFELYDDLINYLRRRRVPVSTKWGRGRAKTSLTLFKQLTKDEARIFEYHRTARKLWLMLYRRIVSLQIVHDVPPGEVAFDASPYVFRDGSLFYEPEPAVVPRQLRGRLFMTHFRQEYGEGGFHLGKFPMKVSETMLFSELSFIAAVIRAIMEELGFEPSKQELATLRSLEQLVAISAPGSHGFGIPVEPGFVRDFGHSGKYPGLRSIKDIVPLTMSLYENFIPDGYLERDDDKFIVFKWLSADEVKAAMAVANA
jgi:hypothetical protein